MNPEQITIDKLTIAVINMKEMVAFYETVFNCSFHEKDFYGTTLFCTEIAGIQIEFCPNKLAQVKAERNRQQFNFLVPVLDKVLENIKHTTDVIRGDIVVIGNERMVTVVDPDENTMVLIERK